MEEALECCMIARGLQRVIECTRACKMEPKLQKPIDPCVRENLLGSRNRREIHNTLSWSKMVMTKLKPAYAIKFLLFIAA